MAGFLDGLKVTLKTTFRRPVTAQYPEPDKRLDIANRFMGFPALTWDSEIGEPYCTGCMVCIRDCPTQCMSAQMKDNPLNAEGKSRRRKIIDTFEINLGRCILCGICVDVCNFDAIEMSHEHELSKYERNGNRVDLEQLLEMGKEYQAEVAWTPRQPEKNSGVPIKKEAGAASGTTKEKRLAAARARAASKRQAAQTDEPSTAISSEAKPRSEMTPEERVAAARARTAAKRQAAETDGASEARPKSEMTPEERVAAARARTRARREAAEDSDNNHEDKPEENVTE